MRMRDLRPEADQLLDHDRRTRSAHPGGLHGERRAVGGRPGVAPEPPRVVEHQRLLQDVLRHGERPVRIAGQQHPLRQLGCRSQVDGLSSCHGRHPRATFRGGPRTATTGNTLRRPMTEPPRHPGRPSRRRGADGPGHRRHARAGPGRGIGALCVRRRAGQGCREGAHPQPPQRASRGGGAPARHAGRREGHSRRAAPHRERLEAIEERLPARASKPAAKSRPATRKAKTAARAKAARSAAKAAPRRSQACRKPKSAAKPKPARSSPPPGRAE